MLSSDLKNREDIECFVESFYSDLLNDSELAPIFLQVAEVDLKKHLPLIADYWEKLLLGGSAYNRHTMNIHRAVNAKRLLTEQDYQHWLEYFIANMDKLYAGPNAERAKQIATTIAANMKKSLLGTNSPEGRS